VYKEGNTETQGDINYLFYTVGTVQNLYFSNISDSSEHRISEAVDFLRKKMLACDHRTANNGAT
jgi:hypothetical protein